MVGEQRGWSCCARSGLERAQALACTVEAFREGKVLRFCWKYVKQAVAGQPDHLNVIY